MFQIERQEQILEYINQTQKANTNELADKFNVPNNKSPHQTKHVSCA